MSKSILRDFNDGATDWTGMIYSKDMILSLMKIIQLKILVSSGLVTQLSMFLIIIL